MGFFSECARGSFGRIAEKVGDSFSTKIQEKMNEAACVLVEKMRQIQKTFVFMTGFIAILIIAVIFFSLAIFYFFREILFFSNALSFFLVGVLYLIVALIFWKKSWRRDDEF